MSTTTRRTDSELKSAVIDELRWIPSVNSTHIGVSVNGGAVTLSGEVNSFPEKVLAAKAAERVHGVAAIAQEITVYSTWSEVTDTDIARDAGEAVRFGDPTSMPAEPTPPSNSTPTAPTASRSGSGSVR